MNEQLENAALIYTQQVAWGDMDALGHVNNVLYYRYIESARIAYFNQVQLFDLNINAVVASNQCKYIRPVFYPDILQIAVQVVELRNSAFRMQYTLYSEQQQQVVATAEAVVVCVDIEKMQKISMPDVLKQNIKNLNIKT